MPNIFRDEKRLPDLTKKRYPVYGFHLEIPEPVETPEPDFCFETDKENERNFKISAILEFSKSLAIERIKHLSELPKREKKKLEKLLRLEEEIKAQTYQRKLQAMSKELGNAEITRLFQECLKELREELKIDDYEMQAMDYSEWEVILDEAKRRAWKICKLEQDKIKEESKKEIIELSKLLFKKKNKNKEPFIADPKEFKKRLNRLCSKFRIDRDSFNVPDITMYKIIINHYM